MPRIEPTIGPNPAKESDPSFDRGPPRTPSRVNVRRANQGKVAISSFSLFALVAGVIAFLFARQQGVDRMAVAYHFGQTVPVFIVSTVVVLGFTFFSRKLWSWGFTVLLFLVVLPITFKLAMVG